MAKKKAAVEVNGTGGFLRRKRTMDPYDGASWVQVHQANLRTVTRLGKKVGELLKRICNQAANELTEADMLRECVRRLEAKQATK